MFRPEPAEICPMRQPQTVRSLEAFGRVRLSESFFMRDFLYSEIAAINGFANLPDNPDLAIELDKKIKEKLGIGARVDAPADPVPAVDF